ncbi:MAG: aldehyde ferredoxin oxidoreductase C-terminal domain-containing protein [Chloroflexota bacterium]|nr:aldehyde ferredoxin oxidoreductase C-terminal domain-containing protein [Chloroflexota bacterium]
MQQRFEGLMGRILRVDLTSGDITVETPDEGTLRRYLGGVGLGIHYVFNEVGPGVQWDQPENRFFVGSGPLGGTVIGGSGSIAVVTVGAMTGGFTTSEAMGFMGAYLKSAGFDGVLIHGAAPEWKYLYIRDGGAELRDARHLLGKDTWETEDAVKAELGLPEQQASVFSIGPAGENLVRFAALVGDRGHVAGHNGPGAVLGSKHLKAIAVARGALRLEVHDAQKLKEISDALWEENKKGINYTWGTSQNYTPYEAGGWLPVKNYTTTRFPEHARFMGESYRQKYDLRRHPCWACQSHHCNIMKIKDGPYAGYEGEEPEYEQWAATGSAIGQTDVDTAAVLSNDVNKLGMENNEVGWLIGWVMECYERGLLDKDDLDGLEMRWGNGEGARQLLSNTAHRRGFGNILAEGVMRASQRVGGDAGRCAIYTPKGGSPRGHDHRSRWSEMLDTSVSNTGTMETMVVAIRRPEDYGLPKPIDPFNPQVVAAAVAKSKGAMQFEDSMVTCRFITHMDVPLLCRALEASTGWHFTFDEALTMGRRVVNMMRVFNLRRGLGKRLEYPSERYGSTPTDGPNAGKAIQPHWDDMLRTYYRLMGWDEATGVPLPETLRSLGLEM